MDAAFLTQKLGPAPIWAWGGAGLAAALVIANYRAGKTPKAATPNATDGTVPADQVPAYINQNYITVNPAPEAPDTPSAPPVKPPHGRPPAPPPDKDKGGAKVQQYRVKHGDTLTSIAKRYHTTVAAIWKYNTTAGNRPAATIKQLKDRGPNLLYPNELILIPPIIGEASASSSDGLLWARPPVQ